jgi:hypothetical protein
LGDHFDCRSCRQHQPRVVVSSECFHTCRSAARDRDPPPIACQSGVTQCESVGPPLTHIATAHTPAPNISVTAGTAARPRIGGTRRRQSETGACWLSCPSLASQSLVAAPRTATQLHSLMQTTARSWCQAAAGAAAAQQRARAAAAPPLCLPRCSRLHQPALALCQQTPQRRQARQPGWLLALTGVVTAPAAAVAWGHRRGRSQLRPTHLARLDAGAGRWCCLTTSPSQGERGGGGVLVAPVSCVCAFHRHTPRHHRERCCVVLHTTTTAHAAALQAARPWNHLLSGNNRAARRTRSHAGQSASAVRRDCPAHGACWGVSTSGF